jgi:hypothetical protein
VFGIYFLFADVTCGDHNLGRGMTMWRLDWMARVCAAVVVALGGATPAAMAEVRQDTTPAARVTQRQTQARVVVALGRLHQVAQREIALSLLAQVAAVNPQTVVFATEMETAFRALDGRVVAFAKLIGVAENRLRSTDAGDNTLALHREADLDRLSMARGQDFDRLLWMMVAKDHLAASARLASATGVAGVDRRLDALVADMALLLEKFGRKAVVTAASIDRP